MTFSITSAGIRGILLDIEGTTTPVQFVYDVLFPFVRSQLSDFFLQNHNQLEVQEVIVALKLDHEDDLSDDPSTPEWSDPPAQYVNWLMDQDRKSTALKALQGRMWQDGYRSGKLHGQVFADVPPALQRWRKRGLDIRIFSSGSELAQRLLFGSTEFGDLTSALTGYFDTRIGAKIDPKSYLTIANAFHLRSEQIVFISDITRELDAAHAEGLATILCVRPGNQPQVTHGHRSISSFDEILN